MLTCLWPPTSHRYIDVVVEVVVDDGVDVVVDDGVDVVVVITDADMSLAAYISQVYLHMLLLLLLMLLLRLLSIIIVLLPQTELDYGSLLCFGFNTLGKQLQPCVFTILPAGTLLTAC